MLTETDVGKLRNFRDIGGRSTRGGREVRPGAVYRCGCMHLWTADEAKTIRRRIGPQTLIDLRRPDEARRFPVPVAELGAAYLSAPFPTKTSVLRPRQVPSLVETYVAIATRSGPSIIKMLETLSDPANLPAIVFCAAGKDRTGMATAILLGALNVDDDQIVADYALSGIIDPSTLGDGYAEQFAGLPVSYHGSDPRTMRAALGSLRQDHGSIRTFVAKLGFDASKLVALERALLRPAVADQPTRPVT